MQGHHGAHGRLGGAPTLAGSTTDAPTLRWTDGSAGAVGLDGGSIAGGLSLLAPANASRTGGTLAEAAAAHDRVATDLATAVNTLHAAGTTPSGATGTPFFALAAGVPAPRASPSSRPTRASSRPGTRPASSTPPPSRRSPRRHPCRGPGHDLGDLRDGVGSASRTATSEATLTGLALTNARSQQQSSAGVSMDEENVSLLAYQHAYQGAARVLTAVDEMLDTIINRLGLVGRS